MYLQLLPIQGLQHRLFSPGLSTMVLKDMEKPPCHRILEKVTRLFLKFLSSVDLSRFKDPFLIEDILSYVGSVAPGNYAAKASVDIALHDLVGKLIGKPWFRFWGLDPAKAPFTSFTIGIDTPEVIKQKVAEAQVYRVLKVKLGAGTDKEIINAIRSVTDKTICVDVNQGWKERNFAWI